MPTLLISHTPIEDMERTTFENDVLSEICRLAEASIIRIPHLYYLTEDHLAVEAILRAKAPIVIGAWMYERSIEWVAKSLCGNYELDIRAIDFRRFPNPKSCADEYSFISGSDYIEEASSALTDLNTDVNVRWYPVIDRNRCTNCKQCYDFCLFGTYTTNDCGKVTVSNPDKCKPGCPACARICPNGAIIFPECPTDEAVAGKKDVNITKAQNEHDARSFAGESVRQYKQLKSTTIPDKAKSQPDELDEMIRRLEDLDCD